MFASVDLFVVLDCVQFPRRGWVHRNRLTTLTGALDWLTLPLRKAPRYCAIADMRFADDVRTRLIDEGRRFEALRNLDRDDRTRDILQWPELQAGAAIADYLERTLMRTAAALGLAPASLRSSALNIPPEIRNQERILAICDAVGAKTYVNAPGGVDLYQPQTFAARGIELRFLDPWAGPYKSMLEILINQQVSEVSDEIRRQSITC